ncbi:MAG: DUF92 domain-containing protein [Candidatus Coproplasma sp.]
MGILPALFIALLFFEQDLYVLILIGVLAVGVTLASALKLFNPIAKREKTLDVGIITYSLTLFVLSALSYFCYGNLSLFTISFVCMVLGDASGAIFGEMISSPNISEHKSFAGSLACLVFSYVGLITFSFIVDFSLDISHLAIIAGVACCAEMTEGEDNVFVPVLTFLTALLLQHFEGTEIALCAALCVFAVAYLSKAINYNGSFLAAIIGFASLYFGGTYYFLFVLGCYVSIIILALVRKLLRKSEDTVVKKTHTKDCVQVFVNGAFPLLSLILFAITGNAVFKTVFLITMSASFVDSYGSDFGMLFKGRPYNIFKRKYTEAGVSGSVSAAGTLASLVGSLCFAALICVMTGQSFVFFPLYFVLIVIGTVVDTILGGLVQVKYTCPVCGQTTERLTHCGRPTLYLEGCRFIDNDAVNFLSSAAVFLLSMTLMLL